MTKYKCGACGEVFTDEFGVSPPDSTSTNVECQRCGEEQEIELYVVKYAINGRPVTITGYYEGEPGGDPPGLYYVFDDTPTITHWMAQTAVPIRMQPMENDDGKC